MQYELDVLVTRSETLHNGKLLLGHVEQKVQSLHPRIFPTLFLYKFAGFAAKYLQFGCKTALSHYQRVPDKQAGWGRGRGGHPPQDGNFLLGMDIIMHTRGTYKAIPIYHRQAPQFF